MPFFIPLLIAAATAAAGAGASAIGARKARRQARRDAANPPHTNVPTMSPEQISFINALAGMGLQGAQEMQPRLGGDVNQGFQPFENQARQNFNQQQVPGMMRGMESLGSGLNRSSGFPQALGQMQGDFEGGLNQMRSQYGNNRMGQEQNFLSLMSGQGLQQQFEPIYQQKPQNPWGQIGGAGINMMARMYGSRMGNQNQGGSLW